MSHLEALTSQPWAIRPEVAAELLRIACEGRGEEHGLALAAIVRGREERRLEAMLASGGAWLAEGSRVILRDGVGIVRIRGPLVKHATLFSDVSGLTSMEQVAGDLNAALASPRVHAVILDVDSPGGQAKGVAELAAMIRSASDVKPISAYAGADCCSAAYWLASAAGEVVADRLAALGSIGVVMSARSTKGMHERLGIKDIEIVSSRAPKKRLDLETDEGRVEAQRIVDRIEEEFVADVAKHRDVDAATVTGKFGQGGVLIGSDAVAAGMADRLGSLESLIGELSAAHGPGSGRSVFAVGAGGESEFMADESKDTKGSASTQAAAPLPPLPVVPTVDHKAEMARLQQTITGLLNEGYEAKADALLTEATADGRMAPAEQASLKPILVAAFQDDRDYPRAGISRADSLRSALAARPKAYGSLLTENFAGTLVRPYPPAPKAEEDKHVDAIAAAAKRAVGIKV